MIAFARPSWMPVAFAASGSRDAAAAARSATSLAMPFAVVARSVWSPAAGVVVVVVAMVILLQVLGSSVGCDRTADGDAAGSAPGRRRLQGRDSPWRQST